VLNIDLINKPENKKIELPLESDKLQLFEDLS